MVGPRASLRALVATLGVTVLVLLGTLPTVGAADADDATAPRAASAPAADDESPLAVTIDSMSPSYLPRKGRITVTGTVTNRSDETWTTIKMYPVVGDDLAPMRTEAELEAAVESPPDEFIGTRTTSITGDAGTIASLEPGAAQQFSLSLPVSALSIDQPGVYWFGVHALGESPSSPRNTEGVPIADGKARTFLPYLPPRFDDDPLPGAVVVPVTKQIAFNSDGSLADLDSWQRDLETGRLRALPDLVSAAGSTPMTYLVDPAVLDAVVRVARGNPARSLGPTGGATPGTESPTDQPSEDADEDADGDGDTLVDPEDLPEDVAPAARAAIDWLDAFSASLPGNQVLTLPYGNLDLSAAASLGEKKLYQLALAQRDTVLGGLDVDDTPAVTSPRGYVDGDAIGLTDPDATVLLTDGAFRGRAPGVADVDGHRAVVTSSGFAKGGPGPSDAYGPVALRQRLLGEAVVHLLGRDPQPLVVTVPPQWKDADASAFVSGLDVPWLDLGSVDDVAGSTIAEDVDPADLVYPPAEARRQVERQTFDSARRLIASGDSLQSLLTDNNDVGGVITEQALTALGYTHRGSQARVRTTTDASDRWVRDRLESVEVSAPRGVTLSSASGSFAATLSNDLDESVTVGVEGRSADGGLQVAAPKPVVLAAHSRTTVLLKATASSNRVHNVTLRVTDADGRATGPTDTVPIRSAQVSNVIWLIMGTGAGLLFLAIFVRLFRRIRNARRGGPAAGPADGAAPEASPDPTPTT